MDDAESEESVHPTQYGWYSSKQELLLKTQRVSVSADVRGVPIYIDLSGKKVRVTMVSRTPHHGTVFEDIECVGQLKEFAGIGEFREDL